MRAERRKKKKNKKLKIFGFVFLLLLFSGFAYGATVYTSLQKAVNTMQGSDHKSEKRQEEVAFTEKDPLSILILGVDERQNDRGRSDTMIVMTVNPKKESIELLSIPRDTRTEIVGHGTVEKINHAYSYGGVKMSLSTIENFLDIPIDYYVKMNMEGFTDIVDAVNGINVENDMYLSHKGYEFPKGSLTLNGEEALVYSRIRKEDKQRGDFGRQMRQRQVIQAIIKKGASVNSLTNFDDIFQALGKNVETNMNFDEIKDIQKNYRPAINHIEQYTIAGEGSRLEDGLWYYIVPEEEKHKVQARLKKHLDLSISTAQQPG
ncbi:LCP family glycopolymer transferase [Peribacillus glennii]|uniref:LytR family transcriptional regulator n=1 Tax=Peribacillus glennii TaxID=2303991 RepID=A0A372LDC6_9BACI|nr:LCP family protein [Peribacillus glennii]RFU63977.1 LytR family transcriptional regulator [Peribacillus glennii]